MKLSQMFERLGHEEAREFFVKASAREQGEILMDLSPSQARFWLRALDPDDIADLIQQFPERRQMLLDMLDRHTHSEVLALLAFAEDVAGGLMSPRFTRVRPEMTAEEALSYVRRQAHEKVETVYYVYVLAADQRLLGVVSARELIVAAPDRLIRDIMHTELVTARESMHQAELSRLFSKHDLIAIPVLDEMGRMTGIVTVDDIVDVVERETTKDIHQIGGSEALDAPYWATGFLRMVRKRAGWLVALFLG